MYILCLSCRLLYERPDFDGEPCPNPSCGGVNLLIRPTEDDPLVAYELNLNDRRFLTSLHIEAV